MMATATALVSKSAEAAASAGLKAVVRLHQLIKQRFAHKPASQAALERAQSDPADHANLAVLAHSIELALEADPRLADQLRTLLPLVSGELANSGTTITNTVHTANNSTITQIGAVTHHHTGRGAESCP